MSETAFSVRTVHLDLPAFAAAFGRRLHEAEGEGADGSGEERGAEPVGAALRIRVARLGQQARTVEG